MDDDTNLFAQPTDWEGDDEIVVIDPRVLETIEKCLDSIPYAMLTAADLARRLALSLAPKLINIARSTPAPAQEPPAKSRASGPATSRAADYSNRPRRGSQRHRIARQLASGRLYTAEQLASACSLPLNSVSTRMSELIAGGWCVIEDDAGRTRNGSAAHRYRATEKGRRL